MILWGRNKIMSIANPKYFGSIFRVAILSRQDYTKSMMTRQHFEAIASILTNDVPVSTVNALADYFASENPNFDRERFIKACGVISGPPRDDKDGVTQTYDALVKAGYDVAVQDGAHEEFVGIDREQAIAEVMSCDEGFFIALPKGETNIANRAGYIYFVFGNSPEEVINDYTTNLDHVIDPLSKRWGW